MTASSPDRPQPLGVAGAFGAAVAWGASGVIAKSIDMDGLAVVAYRFWLSAIVLFVFMAFSGRLPSRTAVVAALPGGLALAADVALFFSAVKLTTVANATVLTAMQPLLMMYLGSRLLGERVGRSQVLWSVVALSGIGLLVYGSAGQAEWDPLGDLLAIGALVAWTGYLFFSKSSQGRVTPLQYTGITALLSAIGATVLAPVFGQDLGWPTARSWLLLGVMAFGSGLCAHLLMNWALTRIPVWLGSATTLLIPASASAMAWIWLDEPLGPGQLFGIALTMLALGAITIGRSQPGTVPAETAVAETG
ncbi:MAG: DMT family transporter [Actinomycetota bacterium]